MSATAKLLQKARTNPAGVRFAELQALLRAAGYVHSRTRGSHEVWDHRDLGVPPISIQAAKGKAKPYQVRQVLALIDAHGLIAEE